MLYIYKYCIIVLLFLIRICIKSTIKRAAAIFRAKGKLKHRFLQEWGRGSVWKAGLCFYNSSRQIDDIRGSWLAVFYWEHSIPRWIYMKVTCHDAPLNKCDTWINEVLIQRVCSRVFWFYEANCKRERRIVIEQEI